MTADAGMPSSDQRGKCRYSAPSGDRRGFDERTKHKDSFAKHIKFNVFRSRTDAKRTPVHDFGITQMC